MYIIFPVLNKYDEENRQLEIKIKNSKKPKKEIDFEIEEIKKLYDSLDTSLKKSVL